MLTEHEVVDDDSEDESDLGYEDGGDGNDNDDEDQDVDVGSDDDIDVGSDDDRFEIDCEEASAMGDDEKENHKLSGSGAKVMATFQLEPGRICLNNPAFFLNVLFNLLEEAESNKQLSAILSWQKGGFIFVVHDEVLLNQLLKQSQCPKVCRSRQEKHDLLYYEFFTKMLMSRFEFSRVPLGSFNGTGFWNPMFSRDHPSLISWAQPEGNLPNCTSIGEIEDFLSARVNDVAEREVEQALDDSNSTSGMAANDTFNLSLTKNFPVELYRVLENATALGVDNAISWHEGGTSFEILDEVAFVDQVLRQSTTVTEMESFTSALSMFDFNRIPKGQENEGGYIHSLFIRGNLEKSKLIQIRSKATILDTDSEGRNTVVEILTPRQGRGATICASSSSRKRKPSSGISMSVTTVDKGQSTGQKKRKSAINDCSGIEPLETRKRSLEKELTDLQQTIESTERASESKQTMVEKLRREQEELKVKLAKDMKAAQEWVESFDIQQAELKVAISSLREVHDELQQKVATLETREKNLVDILAMAEERNKVETKVFDNRASDLKTAVDKLESQKRELAEDVERLAEKRKDAEEKQGEAERSAASCLKILEELNSKKSQMEDNIRAMQSDFDDLESKLHEINEETTRYRRDNDMAAKQKEKLDQFKSTLQESIDALEEEKASLEDYCDQIKIETKELEVEREKSSSTITSKLAEREILEEVKKELESEIDGLKTERIKVILECEKADAAASAARDALEADCDFLKEKKDRLEIEWQHLEDHVDRLEKQKSELDDDQERMEKAAASTLEAKKRLDNDLVELEREIAKLLQEKNNLQGIMASGTGHVDEDFRSDDHRERHYPKRQEGLHHENDTDTKKLRHSSRSGTENRRRRRDQTIQELQSLSFDELFYIYGKVYEGMTDKQRDDVFKALKCV